MTEYHLNIYVGLDTDSIDLIIVMGEKQYWSEAMWITSQRFLTKTTFQGLARF